MARRAGLAVRADRLRRGLIRRKAPSAAEHPGIACGFEANDDVAFLEPERVHYPRRGNGQHRGHLPIPTSEWTLVGPRCPQDRPLVACVPGERLFQTDARGSQGRPPEQSTSTRMTYSRDGRLSGHRQVGMPI
jgi:hypothetical protein